ncbi:hypothetical protein [Paenibacillus medicaginis]|uniref:Uncharacterized protein n=1 Tax=Paenibacillus medicaginis TaxID=1470560 RepID=A0ABV5C3B6_9BACL
MPHPLDELFTTFTRTKDDAMKQIMQSFQEAGLQTKYSMISNQLDQRSELEDVIETPTNSVMEDLRRALEQIQDTLNQHYPHIEDDTSYEDLWSQVNRIASPPSYK